jgi:ketosteroid isomerase-like protein
MIYTKDVLIFLLLSFSNLVVSASDAYSAHDIQRIMPVLEKALNENDINALHAIYSTSATVIPQDMTALKTRLDINSYWNDELEQHNPRFMIDVVDYHVTEDLAYISALWTSTHINENVHINGGAEAIITDGYLYNILYRQEDGRWKILMQQW